ncbi:MAG TPA: FtsX-like permease family protein [Streptosporangiaceae bacterium]|jgi:putative ABC transport system permease protein
MSTALRELPDLAVADHGGMVARRAMIRWAWRLSRREWRQQILVVMLLAIAVAGTIIGVTVAVNAPTDLNTATHGTATSAALLPGADPHLAADIASIRRQDATGPVELIENKTVPVPGSVATADLRAQDPHGRYSEPMLALVSGRYPRGPGEVAVTSGVAAQLGLRTGGRWRVDGRSLRVTGQVENPANLRDQFALLPPGQLTDPSSVTVLYNARRCLTAGCAQARLHLPGGAKREIDQPVVRNAPVSLTPADGVLVLGAFGLIFIGLVAVTGFTVMAQRRQRALGMLVAVGATDRDIRLVMIASGATAGVAGALAGAVLGLGGWLGYAPRLQASVAHVIDPFAIPWLPVTIAMAMAVATAMAGAWRPARTAARVPAMTAMSGRSYRRPEVGRRLAVVACALLAAGLGLLAASGGWARLGVNGGSLGWAAAIAYGGIDTLLLVGGLIATVLGALLLSPLVVGLPAVIAGPAPAAVRLAVRDLGRHRTRSGAALAAVTFAAFGVVLTGILTSASYANPLTYAGPNLAPNQLIVYEPHSLFQGAAYTQTIPPTPAQQHALANSVRVLATRLHARFAIELVAAGRPNPSPFKSSSPTNQQATLWQAVSTGTVPREKAMLQDSSNYAGTLYVATPALLRAFGIKPGQVSPDADVLTTRAGLPSVPDLELLGQGDIITHMQPVGHEVSETHLCPPSSCIAHPRIQVVTGLPAGTSAPSTIITEHAVRALGQQLIPDGWLIQTSAPLTPVQISAARLAAAKAGSRIETASGQPSGAQLKGWAIVVGLLIALTVLVMTAGLVRAETASDLRTLTAAGAGPGTRRALAAVTAGILGLLGALLGTATAYLAVTAWAHASLASTLNPVPVADLAAILVGLPLATGVAGGLLSGRQPPAIARQPLE